MALETSARQMLHKISDTIWELPTTFKTSMQVPARIYATEKLVREMDEAVFDQVTNVATLPGIIRYACCMPDGHSGYGFPIGGVAAMDVELLLLGHVEGFGQLVPVVLLAFGLAVLVWHAVAPRAATVRAVQLVMILFVVSGVAGIVLHYRGNAEFELEMYPSLGGTELIGKTLTGATPVLAPGSMALLGLAGLVHAYQHPRRKGG